MQRAGEFRGVYAHFASEVPDSESGAAVIRGMLRELSELGVTAVLPLAKDTSSRVSYASRLLPRLLRNVDVMGEVSEACNDYGMEVHAWVCAFVERSVEESPVLSKHPDWAFVDRAGEPVGALCPSNEEARRFLLSVVEELLSGYEVDGVSLDYVRTPSGLCYCDNCVREFRRVSGQDPRSLRPGSEGWYEWEEWQRENVTAFVREAHDLVRRYGVRLSSYVWTSTSRYTVAQDWPAWVRRGYLDFVIPTGYVYSVDVFRKLCQEAKAVAGGIVPVCMCIGIRTSHGFLERPEDVLTYVDVVRRVGLEGFVLFSLSSLLPMASELRGRL